MLAIQATQGQTQEQLPEVQTQIEQQLKESNERLLNPILDIALQIHQLVHTHHQTQHEQVHKTQPLSLHQNKCITSSVNTTKISIVVLDIILHLQIKIHCNNNLKVINYYINNN